MHRTKCCLAIEGYTAGILLIFVSFNLIKSFGIQMNPSNQIANWRSCQFKCAVCAYVVVCNVYVMVYERNRTFPSPHKYMNRLNNLIYIQKKKKKFTYASHAITSYLLGHTPWNEDPLLLFTHTQTNTLRVNQFELAKTRQAVFSHTT